MKFKAMLKKVFRVRRKTVEVKVAAPSIRLLHTIEGTVLYSAPREVYRAVQAEFNLLPESVRRPMCFSPESGEWVLRAHWWRELLYRALAPTDAARAMVKVLAWYRHCIGMRGTKHEHINSHIL